MEGNIYNKNLFQKEVKQHQKITKIQSGNIWFIKRKKNEICSKGGKIAGKMLYKNKKGLFGMTDEDALKSQIKGGKIQGNKNKENKLGICGISKEQRSENTKKQNSTRWKCLVTGHISTYNALSRFQNNRRIDKSMRVMV